MTSGGFRDTPGEGAVQLLHHIHTPKQKTSPTSLHTGV